MSSKYVTLDPFSTIKEAIYLFNKKSNTAREYCASATEILFRIFCFFFFCTEEVVKVFLDGAESGYTPGQARQEPIETG